MCFISLSVWLKWTKFESTVHMKPQCSQPATAAVYCSQYDCCLCWSFWVSALSDHTYQIGKPHRSLELAVKCISMQQSDKYVRFLSIVQIRLEIWAWKFILDLWEQCMQENNVSPKVHILILLSFQLHLIVCIQWIEMPQLSSLIPWSGRVLVI